MKKHLLVLCTQTILLSSGCSIFCPQWHDGSGPPLKHRVGRAEAHDNRLTITGYIGRAYSFTDYGAKVYRVVDDHGTALQLRSFQIAWAKGIRFELEFSSPHPEAESVEYDIAFTSRSGVDRITGTAVIEKGKGCFQGRWDWQPRKDKG